MAAAIARLRAEPRHRPAAGSTAAPARSTAQGARAGPGSVAAQPFYVDDQRRPRAPTSSPAAFDPDAMTLFDAWAGSGDRRRAAIARGARCSTRPDRHHGRRRPQRRPRPARDPGTCTTCHDAPNVGNHSVALPIDIGLADGSRRTPDMPLYTLRNLATGEDPQDDRPGPRAADRPVGGHRQVQGPRAARPGRARRRTSTTARPPTWARSSTSTTPASASASPTGRRPTWSRSSPRCEAEEGVGLFHVSPAAFFAD